MWSFNPQTEVWGECVMLLLHNNYWVCPTGLKSLLFMADHFPQAEVRGECPITKLEILPPSFRAGISDFLT